MPIARIRIIPVIIPIAVTIIVQAPGGPGGRAAPLFDALVRATVGLCLHGVLRRGRLEKRLHALRRATNKHTGRCPLRVSLSAPLVRPSAWRCEARLRTSSSAARARQSRRSAPKLLTAAAALPACPWTADATTAHKHTNTQTNAKEGTGTRLCPRGSLGSAGAAGQAR